MVGFDAIPVSAEFAEPVFVDIEDMLNKTLPKLPNLVSSPAGPLSCEKPIASKMQNEISIAAKIVTPLPFPKRCPYATGNENGITIIRIDKKMFEMPFGFSNG
jgi:hypothetical protein